MLSEVSLASRCTFKTIPSSPTKVFPAQLWEAEIAGSAELRALPQPGRSLKLAAGAASGARLRPSPRGAGPLPTGRHKAPSSALRAAVEHIAAQVPELSQERWQRGRSGEMD